MSRWTYVSGVIDVSPLGRSQPEMRYVLDTVLAHLPKVTGSEGNMNVYVIQKAEYNHSSSTNEFGQFSDLSNGCFDSFKMQDNYILAIDASLRDRTFERTMKEFARWLCRLSKRIWVNDILVKVRCSYGETHLFSDPRPFKDMFEYPRWSTSGEEFNWCEFMMWNTEKDSDFPEILGQKYRQEGNKK